MQYILSQEEYDAIGKQQHAFRAKEHELQLFATLAANSIPVACDWEPGQPPRPWGCIFNEVAENPGYCDHCPAQIVCPSTRKEFSK